MIRINKIIVDKFVKFFTIYAGGINKSNCLNLSWILKGFITKTVAQKQSAPTYSNLGTLENKASGASQYATEKLLVSSSLPTYQAAVKENSK